MTDSSTTERFCYIDIIPIPLQRERILGAWSALHRGVSTIASELSSWYGSPLHGNVRLVSDDDQMRLYIQEQGFDYIRLAIPQKNSWFLRC